MFFKTTLFLFGFLPAVLLSQNEDSVLIDPFPHAQDSLQIVHADSSNSSIDSLVTLSEKVPKYIYQQPFSDQSTFITKSDILRNDYRYAGDFLKLFPFSFERSYGFIGQSNDVYLYGEGLGSTSYFTDGVPIRITDFNHIQSEDIDSIEIVPLPRGFVYGFSTNPVSVNFSSKDIIPTKPYSRIKYYEGPFGEAFIDGTFSMYLFKDLIASVDLTNRKVDDSYKNSAFSIWQVKSKLRYNLSDGVNLIGSYYFSKSETGINGGVNVDVVMQTTQDVNSILYNETLAPVWYENNSLDFKQHNFGLKILVKPFENSYTNLNFYYKFYQNEYNESDTSLNSKITSKDKLLGVVFDQRISFSTMNLSLHSGYQSLKHNPTFTSSDSLNPKYYFNNYNSTLEYGSFFVSSLISIALLEGVIVPSAYFKYANTLQKNTSSGTETLQKYNGFGTDLSIFLNEHYNFYLGYSQFDDYYLIGEKTTSLELKLGYKDENNSSTINLFNKESSTINLWGIGFDVSYQIWKILFEGRMSQYFVEKDSPVNFINIPETKFNAGIYFKDSLFSSNLDLKAGFLVNYIGKQDLRTFSVTSPLTMLYDVEPWFTIDFTISAEIQKSAIVYFTWENLLDKKYYITPYYPMPERNIRFGVAWELFN
jgi:outer membrane receptor protein involved in Fe transport